MLKPFTKEGRFECGFDIVVRGRVWCFTPASALDHPIGLGVAIANQSGYIPIPLHWCNADTYDEMQAHADALNEAEGIDKLMSAKIVCSSMRSASKPPASSYFEDEATV